VIGDCLASIVSNAVGLQGTLVDADIRIHICKVLQHYIQLRWWLLHNIMIHQIHPKSCRADDVGLGMLGAGSLALVLTAFANADFRSSSLISAPGKEGKGKGAKSARREVLDETVLPHLSLTAINAEASAL